MLKVGDSVIVGEPRADDLHQHGFMGTVVAVKSDGVVVVEDQDGNCFDVGAERVSHG